MQNQLVDTFLASTYSLSQVRSNLSILKNYLLNQFFNSKLQGDGINPEDINWLKSLGTDFYKNFNKTNVYEQLEAIEKEIKKIPPLIIYIPFDMPDEEKIKLGIWLRTNISPTIIYDLRFDSNLIAGCALSSRGIYKDYSLKDNIDKRRDEVISSMKSFLK